METFAALVFFSSLAAAFPVFAASIYCTYALNRYLKQAHPEIWAKISPHPLTQASLSSPNARFVTQRTYRTVKDERLHVLGDRCFRLLYFAVSTFLLVVLSGLFYDAIS
jgi:hypothetical protein